MVTRNGIITEVEKGLKRCGYRGNLLREEYRYEDSQGEHIVPLAGFATRAYDARTSCISAVVASGSQQATAEYVNSFRGLGAPIVLACQGQRISWWAVRADGAHSERDVIERDELPAFFDEHKEEFAPDRIWRAKNPGRVDTRQQLSFVDIGLMPLLEEEMGESLGGLMTRVISSLQGGFTENQLKKSDSQRWVFRVAFWLLCAKILKDKRVESFVKLDLTDVADVLCAVKTHYGAQLQVEASTKKQMSALCEAAQKINGFANLSNLTTEAFGYMYENIFVDKKLRAALGIHATPSYLVDYIVWQLWPLIEQIPESERVVLEPACGHAPFLTSAMRMLRFLRKGKGDFHKYARERLIGIECDSFAREIARLSLTMADVPNPNGWKIMEGDIYEDDTLSEVARKATILLCNPPFENFSPALQKSYNANGAKLKSLNKGAEMLWRTLPNMQEGSVFGVVLPLGFLHKKNLAELRKMILDDCELSQICELPKGVFRHANHESVVLSGRKRISTTPKSHTKKHRLLHRVVTRRALSGFRERYEGSDRHVLQSALNNTRGFDYRVTLLRDVWDYCRENMPTLGTIGEGGQGLMYKGGGHLPKDVKTFEKQSFVGAVKGYVRFGKYVKLHELPAEYWMNLAPEVIRRPMWGAQTGTPQVLINYGPVGMGPWRLKVLVEPKGRPVSSRFLVFRPKNADWSLNTLWGVLNSPLSNAFIYEHTTDRDIPAGVMREVPVPLCSRRTLLQLDALVREYFGVMRRKESELGRNVADEAKRLLLLIDAEVLRLYDLPPRMEKRVLDMFQGVQRKGVDFEFTGYYPEGFESAIPLHEYLSEEYQRSTVDFVEKWVEENRSAQINEVFERALEAFGER